MTARPGDKLIERIERALAQRGKSARWLSIEVTGRPDLVRDIKRRGHLPSSENLLRIAQILGVSVEYLLGESEDAAPMQSEVSVGPAVDAPQRGDDLPPIPLVGTGDCGEIVLTDEQGQSVEIERMSFDPDFHVRYLKRPPALAQARDCYAIYFHGSSMEPRFFAGEIGVVDPTRPASPGDFVLVQLTNGENDEVTSVIVKRLLRQNAREVWLEQYNPARTFCLPRARVLRLHRIIPQTELLF